MATSPIEPSKFHQVIRELAHVRTSGGFAALTEGLLFLAEVFILFLVNDNIHKLILSILMIIAMVGYGVFAFLNLKNKEINNIGGDTNEPKRSITKRKSSL